MVKINHLGLIPDGNRRWALKNLLDYSIAYEIAMQNLIKFIRYSFAKGIRSLSIYLLSTENFKRQREDLDAVLAAETLFVKELLPNVAKELQLNVIHAGNMNILPNDIRDGLKDICQETHCYNMHRLYLLIGYNPIDEIASLLMDKDVKGFSIKNLWVGEEIDVVIRTGGGPALISNFLPLQCGYAQIHIVEKYFNDFTESDFVTLYKEAIKVTMCYGE